MDWKPPIQLIVTWGMFDRRNTAIGDLVRGLWRQQSVG